MEKEVQERINQAFETIPSRFHDDFAEVINSCEQTVKSVRKNEEYFLDNIMDELTEEEKKKMFTQL